MVKAGAGMSHTVSGALLVNGDFAVDTWIVQAESDINNAVRFNFTDVYGTLNNDVKKTLEGAASDLAAINCVAYDLSEYNSRVEAEDIINILRDSALRRMSILRDKKQEDFIRGA